MVLSVCFLVVIETIISLFIRALALGVRLTANLTAGHLLIQLIGTITIIIAIIQAYVFVLLLSLYPQENV
uniref:F-ATPase protein 6 n=1 Tax=Oryzias latipes TaxID=8090 RepID=A0A3P9MKC4_ORYLA